MIKPIRRVGEKPHNLFKFVLNNNNGKRVSIVVWNENIDRILDHIIEINRVKKFLFLLINVNCITG